MGSKNKNLKQCKGHFFLLNVSLSYHFHRAGGEGFTQMGSESRPSFPIVGITLGSHPTNHDSSLRQHEEPGREREEQTKASGTPQKYAGNSKFARCALHEISHSCPNRQAA